MPQEILWQEMDYTPEQIAEMQASDEYKSRQASRDMLMQMAQGGGKGESADDEDEGDGDEDTSA